MISTTHNCGRVEGERRRDNALDLLSERREAVIRQAQRALLRLLLDRGTATADDVRSLVELPPGVNPKVFGAAPGALARLYIIEAAGFTPSCRPVAHARPVRVWQLIDRSAAEDWLRAHPPLPTPDDTAPAAGVQMDLFTNTGATAATAAPIA